MNVQLEKLFTEYELSEKDRYEILQMFQLLPDAKKQKILSDFEILAEKIEKISDDITIEQWILLDSILPEISKIIQKK